MLETHKHTRTQIIDPAVRLARQVHPTAIQNGRVSGTVAWSIKSPDNDFRTSVACLDRTTPAEAYAHYTRARTNAEGVESRLSSVGALIVSVASVNNVGATAWFQPLPDDEAHGHVDFKPLTKSRRVAAARQLTTEENFMPAPCIEAAP